MFLNGKGYTPSQKKIMELCNNAPQEIVAAGWKKSGVPNKKINELSSEECSKLETYINNEADLNG